MAYEKEIIITANTKGAVDGLKGVDENLKKVSGTATNTNSELSEVSKGALDSAKNFKVMGVSLNDVSKGLKLFKISLIATGIGAIVVIVGALAAAFLSTQEGVDKLNSVMMPLKEVMQTILGVAQKLGTGLFQMVSGDVQKGWKTMGKAVENVGEQMKTAYERGTKLYDLSIKIADLEIGNSLVLSTQNRNLANQLEIAEDITQSVEDRRAAYKNAAAAVEVIKKVELQLLDAKILDAKERVKANNTDRQAKKDLNDLAAKRAEIENAATKQQTLLTKKLNVVKVEGIKEEAEAREEARKAVKEIDTTLEGTGEEELLRQRLIGDQKIAQNRAIQDQMKLYNDEIRAEDLAAQDAYEQSLQNMKVSIRQNTIDLIANIAKKGSAVSKAIQIAEIIREQISSGSKSLSAMTVANAKAIAASPLTGGQPFVTINTAQVLTGMALSAVGAGKAIKDIMSESKNPTTFQSGGAGGSGSAPSAPSFNLVQGTGSNQIAQGLNSQQRPIQAYVVSNNVTSAQALDRNIIAGASL